MLFINGLPVATVELKNPITGQTVENAKRQYMKDRDPRELLLSFKARCLVHFAVDTEEVWMTTKLNGINTYFLPFNKGNNGGKGNPVGNSTYREAENPTLFLGWHITCLTCTIKMTRLYSTASL